MPACVLVLKERASAETLYGSLQDAGVPLTRVALVAPDQVDPGQGVLTPEPMEQVELLNPSISRNRRQKSMSRWLLPFGFMAGLTFTQITTLDTFSQFGPIGEALIGGLLGMGSGLMGSYAAAASVDSENEAGVRILRNRRDEGSWLVVVETPNGIEAPWQVVQRNRPQQVVRLNDL